MPIGLSSLSPELHVNILQCLSSSRDLYSAISASSQFYRTFVAYKQSILSVVLLHAIPPETELDFLLAFRAQHIWPLEGLFDALEEEILSILEKFQLRTTTGLHELLSHRSRTLEPWRFYSHFEFFMDSYCTRAFQRLGKPLHNNEGVSEPSPLSLTERIRLQRAFFRCEIYVCLFQVSQALQHHPRSPHPSEPAAKFEMMLPPWEIEEFACVAQFYIALVEVLHEKIEDDFVELVKAKHENDSSTLSEHDSELEDSDLVGSLEFFLLQFYESSNKRHYHKRHTEYLATRGILAVRRLTCAPLVLARSIFLQSELESHRKILITRALEWSHPRIENETDQESVHDKGESSSDCNTGWSWAFENTRSSKVNVPVNHELRNQGYVFWDRERLDYYPIFRTSRPPVGDVHTFPREYQVHSTLPGVDERLKDINLLRSLWRIYPKSFLIFLRRAWIGTGSGLLFSRHRRFFLVHSTAAVTI